MARIFDDQFAGTADTALTSHTPDVGSWSSVAAWGAGSLLLDGDGTDPGAYQSTTTAAGYLSSASPAAGMVTVGFAINVLSGAGNWPPLILLRMHASQKSAYQLAYNPAATRFQLSRWNNGTDSGALKTWTSITLANPSNTDFEVTIEDSGGNPVIRLYMEGVEQGTSFTDSDANKLTGASYVGFGIGAEPDNNCTTTTGQHLARLYVDDTSVATSVSVAGTSTASATVGKQTAGAVSPAAVAGAGAASITLNARRALTVAAVAGTSSIAATERHATVHAAAGSATVAVGAFAGTSVGVSVAAGAGAASASVAASRRVVVAEASGAATASADVNLPIDHVTAAADGAGVARVTVLLNNQAPVAYAGKLASMGRNPLAVARWV